MATETKTEIVVTYQGPLTTVRIAYRSAGLAVADMALRCAEGEKVSAVEERPRKVYAE